MSFSRWCIIGGLLLGCQSNSSERCDAIQDSWLTVELPDSRTSFEVNVVDFGSISCPRGSVAVEDTDTGGQISYGECGEGFATIFYNFYHPFSGSLYISLDDGPEREVFATFAQGTGECGDGYVYGTATLE